MIFAFRGIRFFQVLAVLVTLAAGIAAALAAKQFSDEGSAVMLLAAGLLVLVFFAAFSTALRAPTSFLAISPERTRIRFCGFIDTVIDNDDILGARLVSRSMLVGLGVRTNFGGTVALLTAWGPATELHFRRPVRVWLIPRLIPLKAQRLQLSLLHPAKAVERFGPPRPAGAPNTAGGGRKAGRRAS